MPTQDYVCDACGWSVADLLVDLHKQDIDCEDCGAPARKLVGVPQMIGLSASRPKVVDGMRFESDGALRKHMAEHAPEGILTERGDPDHRAMLDRARSTADKWSKKHGYANADERIAHVNKRKADKDRLKNFGAKPTVGA